MIAAIGFWAALTALNAFTMPAPHSEVVQAHSTLEEVVLEHTGVPAGCGNGLALALIRVINWAGVKLALTARINAATPETMGAEKLVPRFGLVWLV